MSFSGSLGGKKSPPSSSVLLSLRSLRAYLFRPALRASISSKLSFSESHFLPGRLLAWFTYEPFLSDSSGLKLRCCPHLMYLMPADLVTAKSHSPRSREYPPASQTAGCPRHWVESEGEHCDSRLNHYLLPTWKKGNRPYWAEHFMLLNK